MNEKRLPKIVWNFKPTRKRKRGKLGRNGMEGINKGDETIGFFRQKSVSGQNPMVKGLRAQKST